MTVKHITATACLVALLFASSWGHCADPVAASDEASIVRVFIFAGQSNMVGTHSRVSDVAKFPPFAGLDKPQNTVMFSYNLGRETKQTSDGWTALQPTGDYFGPELSFGRKVSQQLQSRIAIIKCASGGTTLGQDWNPDNPGGFKLYPLTLELVRSSLAELERMKLRYRLEGFFWHQGENDMFDKSFKPQYRANLENFIARWRKDLNAPELPFFIGELCTKTVWGMDNRENMLAIRTAQKAVTSTVPKTTYVPTSHDAVEIGGDAGLHYHYGTLGQLEHGENYADAYLAAIGKAIPPHRPLNAWPYAKGRPVKLFILAGHRNMEGERAFKQDLNLLPGCESLGENNSQIAFKYDIGGGFKKSVGWEPLGPAGPYDTFGPELSFSRTLAKEQSDQFAIAKFTHGGTQMNDWTPDGTVAQDMNQYKSFISFIRGSIKDLEERGHSVELAGIIYHAGENDMAYYPYKKNAIKSLQALIDGSRRDLGLPNLKWFVSLQTPPEEKGLNSIHVASEIESLAEKDPAVIYVSAFELHPYLEKLVLNTEGIVKLGELSAKAYLRAK